LVFLGPQSLRAARTLSYLVPPAPLSFHSAGTSKVEPNRMWAEKPAEIREITDHSNLNRAPQPVKRDLDRTEQTRLSSPLKVAILIPCYNEEASVAEVVKQFQAEVPAARIYVFDNNSTDETAKRAQEAGATVFYERRQGKGFVTRAMFREVDADIYVMVDGDNVFPSASVHQLMGPVMRDEADMVVGSRLHADARSEFRPLNRWGNRLVLSLLNSVFGVRLTDILSGYRVFNRKMVKGLPLFGGGFEIETELTIKAIERGYRIVEVPVDLTSRAAGHSKVNLFRDGFMIINTILALFRDYRPLTFFGTIGLTLILAAFAPGLAAVLNPQYLSLFARLALAVFSVGLMLCGLLSLTVGLVLHSIARRSQELEYHLQILTDELRPDLRQRERIHADEASAGLS
jgi:glycosyltransferase involved in cell wall biosynthesis